MRRGALLSALAVGLVLLMSGSSAAQPMAVAQFDHDGTPLSELLDLDDCHVVGNLNSGELLLECPPFPASEATAEETATPEPSDTAEPTETAEPTSTHTPEPTSTDTPAATSTATGVPPTLTVASPTATAIALVTPYPDAPPCQLHANSVFHAVWNSTAGCHHDHEHGQDPFTPEVAAAFPNFDLRAALGFVEVGHQHPTSSAEFTGKHGGWKWQVQLGLPCVAGFEGAVWGVRDAVIGYHAFGPQDVELEARMHSTVMLLNLCHPTTGEIGTLFIIEHQDYGQRVAPYQGFVLPYPDTPLPAYLANLGPYWSVDCVGVGLPGCRLSVADVRARNLNASSTVTSKGNRTGTNSGYSDLLWRTRDNYKILDSSDPTHPFTWLPLGGRWNNSTTRVHEVGGLLPPAWDVDGDRRVTETRALPNGMVVMMNAPVGVKYGADLCPTGAKCSNTTPASNPERDIYFCGPVVCAETAPGARPSGWIGSEN